ncbi:hypothetical protein C6N75_09960 [Streptomyces solincola]|uniref:Uncharacterized protein n=1 Tax=Streptomyces solincola TaxID=2100817 RepID=A0A2S9PYA4_9ACTN|nr:hypothetical protein [Streptomyces solincola]PRH79398.1 hypothetical protein C6N75_09960 [Streptomyces solincola]
MRFFNNVLRRGQQVTLKAGGAQTSSTTGEAVNTGEGAVAVVDVVVTAASGTTPTMTVVVEGSNDGTAWVELGTIGAGGYRAGSSGSAPANFTAAATSSGAFPAPEFIRTRSVIGGTTPSFTYSVSAVIGG